jgi:hypothetical protein
MDRKAGRTQKHQWQIKAGWRDRIRLEVFSLELRDEEAKKQFSNPQNREEIFRTLIEQEGIEITKLTLLKKDEMSLLRRSLGSKLADHNFHIAYPANERSGWICCCAD